jgi:hypothetical protein
MGQGRGRAEAGRAGGGGRSQPIYRMVDMYLSVFVLHGHCEKNHFFWNKARKARKSLTFSFPWDNCPFKDEWLNQVSHTFLNFLFEILNDTHSLPL